jgi:hypothetical protein
MPTPHLRRLRPRRAVAACLAATLLLAVRPVTPAADPNVVVWDTGSRLGEQLENLDRSAWKRVPSDLLELEQDPAKAGSDPGYYGREYTFSGDSVVENRHLLAVFGTALGRVAVFSKTSPVPGDGPPPLAGSPGQRTIDCELLAGPSGPARLGAVELIRHAADEVALSVAFGPAGGAASRATLVFGPGGIVEFRLPEGARGVRLSGAIEYGIVPGFGGDDLILGPGGFPDTPTLSLPSENMLVGLLGGGNRELVVTWPRSGQPARMQLANDASGRRVIGALELENPGSAVYLGLLASPGLWHRREFRPADLETDVALDWKRPFPARWKTQLLEGDVRTTFHFREGRSQIWRGVPGSYSYPTWFDGDTAYLRPSKKVPPKGECLVYFLEGQNTPPAVATPIEILKSTLGREAADARLDLAGRKLRTHHRRAGEGVRRACTCGCTEVIQAVFENRREVARQDEIRGALDDMIYFVARHVERIDEYRRFADGLVGFLRQTGQSAPDLAAFAESLAETAGRIPQECTLQAENMKSPQYADELARRTLALTARHDPKNLEAYMDLLKAWRDMGGAQDYVVALCHSVTRKLFQEAGHGGLANAAAARLGEEVRRRCRQILRNPDGYEIWAEY